MRTGLVAAAVVTALLGAVGSAPAHVQQKEDADDSASVLDVEKASAWHEDGRLFFMIKTYEPWTESDFGFEHGLDIDMDTRGDGKVDYSIFVSRRETVDTAGEDDPKSEVVARLGDWSIEDYLGKVKVERPTGRKAIFSFRTSRIKSRSEYFRWQVEATEGGFSKTAALGEDCAEGCNDRVPEKGWFRHNL